MWNSDLVETIELENVTDQVVQDPHSGKERHESRRAHELPEARRFAADEAHESRLNAKYVEGRTVYALEYQEEKHQVLDDQMASRATAEQAQQYQS